MIRLSINKNLKLRKRERERQAATREVIYNPQSREGYMSSVSTITSTITAVCQCCNITPPPFSKKPALRLCISVLYLQGIFVFMLFQQLIIFIILAFYPFVQVLWQFRFIRVTAVKLLKLIGITYKVLYKILGRVWIISFPINIVFQRSLYKFTGQYFFNFPLVFAINLN